MKAEPVIIVKKRRAAHGGHHGGAWKVAYADFVTAMMAFFLVMWLVTQSQAVKAAVAGYFRDPGVFENESSRGVLPGGTPGAEDGQPPDVAPPTEAERKAEEAAMTRAAQQIRERLHAAPELHALEDQVEITVTKEGLRIELVERNASSFFDSGSAVLRGESERLLGLVAKEISTLDNEAVIEGHTDSAPYSRTLGYTNWELSADRANAARRIMQQEGLRPGQVTQVRGYADTDLKIASDPLDPRNRRVSIVVRSRSVAAFPEPR